MHVLQNSTFINTIVKHIQYALPGIKEIQNLLGDGGNLNPKGFFRLRRYLNNG